MANRAQEAYLTQKILSADPLELVRMLYAGASESVETARACLAMRDIRGRSSAVARSVEILSELASALDHNQAPELCRNLAALYDYMQRRLLEANFQQTEAPLSEVAGLLDTLSEAWKATAPVPVTPNHLAAWSIASGCVAEPALHGWSF